MDTFTKAYVECALWCASDDSGPLDRRYRVGDFAPEALAAMASDCAAFQRANARYWEATADDAQAGRDYFLSRNGYGAGFFEADHYSDAEGRVLQNCARATGEQNVYVGDDGRLYV